jgi:acyl-CoA reductase-like NAD-dependent aldehyde dehydrogenase
LENLIRSTKGKVVSGGEVDMDDRWVSPTLIVDVPKDDVLMQEELFGPILPIVLVTGPLEAMTFIRARGKPLATYIFSDDKHVRKQFTELTSSGGVCINDCIIHAAVTDLPFGGVGESGMGPKYHGVHSFRTFTNEKGIVARRISWWMEWLGRSV